MLRRVPLLGLLVIVAALGPASVSAVTRPELSPISAHFVEAEKATHYTVEVTNATATPVYFWNLKPPLDDATCKVFTFKTTNAEAIWHHASTDGCHHFGIQHDGVITLDVVAGAWHCHATYRGTLDGIGPIPDPCITSVTPPPDKDKKPCKCRTLTVKVDPTLLNKKHLRPDQHDFGVGFTWFMRCGKGKGGCKGTVTFRPPEVLAGTLPKPKNNLLLNIKRLTFTCQAACRRATTGRFQIKMLSRGQLNRLFGRTLAYTIKTRCATHTKTIHVKVFVDQKGRLKPVP